MAKVSSEHSPADMPSGLTGHQDPIAHGSLPYPDVLPLFSQFDQVTPPTGHEREALRAPHWHVVLFSQDGDDFQKTQYASRRSLTALN
jgi:hypothetical protein